MRILIANDDGYLAPGLQALVDACRDLGDIAVVAPEQNASGTSNSLTLHRPLSVFEAANGFRYVNGTPSDCVHVALTGLLPWRPDLVLSGINNGANMGDDTLYSGTVAAAMEGYLFGVPAIAFSQADKGWAELAAASRVARDIVDPSVLQRLLFPLADRVSTNGLALAGMAAWWALWLALIVGVMAPGGAAATRSIAVAASMAFAVIATSGLDRWWTTERPTFAVVVARDDVSVRSEPTPSATALFVARPGTVVAIDRTRESSSLVTSRDGRRGWLESSALATL